MDIFSREYPVVFLVMKKRASSQTQEWPVQIQVIGALWSRVCLPCGVQEFRQVEQFSLSCDVLHSSGGGRLANNFRVFPFFSKVAKNLKNSRSERVEGRLKAFSCPSEKALVAICIILSFQNSLLYILYGPDVTFFIFLVLQIEYFIIELPDKSLS